MNMTEVFHNLKADLFQLRFFSFKLILYEDQMTFFHESSKEEC